MAAPCVAACSTPRRSNGLMAKARMTLTTINSTTKLSRQPPVESQACCRREPRGRIGCGIHGRRGQYASRQPFLPAMGGGVASRLPYRWGHATIPGGVSAARAALAELSLLFVVLNVVIGLGFAVYNRTHYAAAERSHAARPDAVNPQGAPPASRWRTQIQRDAVDWGASKASLKATPPPCLMSSPNWMRRDIPTRPGPG